MGSINECKLNFRQVRDNIFRECFVKLKVGFQAGPSNHFQSSVTKL